MVTQKKKRTESTLLPMENLLKGYQQPEKNKYVSREFQDYGYRLACEMGEEDKKSMYIKMAKTVDRKYLEQARTFVLDAPKVRNRGRLFVWAVGKLKKGEGLGAG
jgi:hypothetical protein